MKRKKYSFAIRMLKLFLMSVVAVLVLLFLVFLCDKVKGAFSYMDNRWNTYNENEERMIQKLTDDGFKEVTIVMDGYGYEETYYISAEDIKAFKDKSTGRVILNKIKHDSKDPTKVVLEQDYVPIEDIETFVIQEKLK